MPLSPEQLNRLQYLLGKSKHTSLTPAEQSEIRQYVVARSPEAKDATFETVVALGLIIVGAYLVHRYIESTA